MSKTNTPTLLIKTKELQIHHKQLLNKQLSIKNNVAKKTYRGKIPYSKIGVFPLCHVCIFLQAILLRY